ncbi:rhodanese-like domain-containing protein [Flagellimonas okinawensis]|uniref:Rhodanese-like domain-containing protein n=1 Tax=Flagellimonas okinawensis TaxID=3031324 RepID=A0ABT5XPQ3_9FLAO|nr:rhodanese-like domain-containing protein [[Muricauda] okinawensis]MDF0707874.1 rhodanese-like domain-containing protein [[Muricauda] okinawensis]
MRVVPKLALYLLFFMGVVSCQSQQGNAIKRIDKQTLKEDVIGKDVQLLDVRTPGEYKAGHIEGAVNFDLSKPSNFLKQLEELDKDRPVYLYCLVGSRSDYAAKVLEEQGFTKIFDYSGGYADWVRD